MNEINTDPFDDESDSETEPNDEENDEEIYFLGLNF